MLEHSYWGEIREGWDGFSPSSKFLVPPFFIDQMSVALGPSIDTFDDEQSEAPSVGELDQYQATMVNFLTQLDSTVAIIKNAAFERYCAVFAHYFEDKEKAGADYLGSLSVETHFKMMNKLINLRVLDHNEIVLFMHYKIDTEHGLEFRLHNNELVGVGGFGDT